MLINKNLAICTVAFLLLNGCIANDILLKNADSPNKKVFKPEVNQNFTDPEIEEGNSLF